MPYRRLPNTDKARLRALEAALKKSVSSIRISNIALAEETIASIQEIYPKFQSLVLNLEAARKQQYQKNKEYIEISKKARLYVSHFIQVVNFMILRGEMKNEARVFYSLSKNDKNIPQLTSDKNLLEWGKLIIEGEQQRIIKGGSPVYNPSIALVKVNYEKFVDSYRFQNILNANSARLSKSVKDIHAEVDSIIVKIWNEVEQYFVDFPESDKREKAAEYGVVYVWRKKELKKLKQQSQEEEKNEILETVMNVFEFKHAEKTQKSGLIEKVETVRPVKAIEPKNPVKIPKPVQHIEHSPVQAEFNF